MIGVDPNNNKYAGMTIEAKNPREPCPMRWLPKDVIMIIFSYVKPDFDALALVNRKFRNIVDDKQLCTPSSVCDKKEWEEHIGDPVEAPSLPRLPRRIHKDLKEGKCLLTLIPHTIKIITNEDKTPREVLLTAKAMGELVKAPKKGHATCYEPNAWPSVIDEERVIEKSHWFVLETEAIGKGLPYSEQKVLAEAKKTATGWQKAKVSDFRDTIISLFIEKIRTGKSYFVWDSDCRKSTWIRVDAMTNYMRIDVSFASSGLYVRTYISSATNVVGIAVARKSIGTLPFEGIG